MAPDRRTPDLMLLAIDNLSHSRGSGDQTFRVEIHGLRVGPGEILALTGESGSGKSTALELIGLVVRPDTVGRFELHIDGGHSDVAALWRRNAQDRLARLRAAGLGFVLQTGGLLPYLSVLGNIRINRRLLRLPDTDEDLESVIDALQIRELLHKRPAQLSIGQQQRASIARALAHRPALLLADEPTSALDPRLAGKVMDLMLDLAHRLGIGVVLVTHEHDRVREHRLREIRAEPLAETLGSRFDGAAATQIGEGTA